MNVLFVMYIYLGLFNGISHIATLLIYNIENGWKLYIKLAVSGL
jgi:hypothetical protein